MAKEETTVSPKGKRVAAPNELPKDFDTNKMFTLLNPLDHDFTFMQNGEPFTVPKGGYLHCNEVVANHGAKHLAYLVVKKNRQVELSDLYDRLSTPGQEPSEILEYRKLLEKSLPVKDLDATKKAVMAEGVLEEAKAKEKASTSKVVKKKKPAVKKEVKKTTTPKK